MSAVNLSESMMTVIGCIRTFKLKNSLLFPSSRNLGLFKLHVSSKLRKETGVNAHEIYERTIL